MFAIVDIETTGGSVANSRITEIAIYLHDGVKLIDEYQSLINPCQLIPYKITQLTGISDETVKDAPQFHQVADKIEAFTKDCVFVAHNVNFDYGFVKAEFERIGKFYRRKKLCTVRLSRKLLPGKFSYSLGRLCAGEDIPLHDRHRAAGDAKATSILFAKLFRLDDKGLIQQSLNPQSLESLIPPNLQKGDFLALPNAQGTYYFLNQKKQIIYIGKAKDLKKRIHSHFSGNTNTKSKYHFVKNIFGIDFKLIPSPLLLDLIEASEIKKHWPIHNRSMKRISLNHGLFLYEDRNGYKRLLMGRCGKHDKPLKSFTTESDLKAFLKLMILNYELCPRLSGLQPIGSGKCNYIEDISCKGACESKETTKMYNARVDRALDEMVFNQTSFLLIDPNIESNQKAAVWVEKGRYKAYANFPLDKKLNQMEKIKAEMIGVYDDQDLSNIVYQHFSRAEQKNIIYLD